MKKFNGFNLFIIAIVLIVVFTFFGIPNYLRYHYEKNFGSPLTFFYGTNLGIIIGDNNYYEDEINLDDIQSHKVDLSKYNSEEVEFYIYGRFVNSAERLVVTLNDKVVYNGKASNEMSNFHSRYYIEKHYVVKLQDFNRRGYNKIVVSTGSANEIFTFDSF